MIPCDDRVEGLLARVAGAPAAGEQSEAVVEPIRDLPQRQAAKARSRELDREWEAVEATADVVDQLPAGRIGVEARHRRLRAHDEQLDCLVERRYLDRPLAAYAQQLTARRQDMFYRLSPTTVYRRFFSPIQEPSRRMLTWFTNVDHDRERGEQQEPRAPEADTERDARRYTVARDRAVEEDRATEAERSERGEPEVEEP